MFGHSVLANIIEIGCTTPVEYEISTQSLFIFFSTYARILIVLRENTTRVQRVNP